MEEKDNEGFGDIVQPVCSICQNMKFNFLFFEKTKMAWKITCQCETCGVLMAWEINPTKIIMELVK